MNKDTNLDKPTAISKFGVSQLNLSQPNTALIKAFVTLTFCTVAIGDQQDISIMFLRSSPLSSGVCLQCSIILCPIFTQYTLSFCLLTEHLEMMLGVQPNTVSFGSSIANMCQIRFCLICLPLIDEYIKKKLKLNKNDSLNREK